MVRSVLKIADSSPLRCIHLARLPLTRAQPDLLSRPILFPPSLALLNCLLLALLRGEIQATVNGKKLIPQNKIQNYIEKRENKALLLFSSLLFHSPFFSLLLSFLLFSCLLLSCLLFSCLFLVSPPFFSIRFYSRCHFLNRAIYFFSSLYQIHAVLYFSILSLVSHHILPFLNLFLLFSSINALFTHLLFLSSHITSACLSLFLFLQLNSYY